LGVEAEILTLPERPSTRQYKWDDLTVARLDKLGELLPQKDEASILRDCIGHFLSTLERDERPWMTVPSELEAAAAKRPKRHKRSGDAG
jgi:hypothetical protein